MDNLGYRGVLVRVSDSGLARYSRKNRVRIMESKLRIVTVAALLETLLETR